MSFKRGCLSSHTKKENRHKFHHTSHFGEKKMPTSLTIAFIVVTVVLTIGVIAALTVGSLAFTRNNNNNSTKGQTSFGDVTMKNTTITGSLLLNPNVLLQLGAFTTRQRLDLDLENGTVVYDTDFQALYIFSRNAWIPLLDSLSSSSLSLTNQENGNIIVDLAPTGVIAGTYVAPNLTIDALGRIQSATSNSGVVVSVSGTAGQINSTGGVNPVISLNNTLLASIQSWQNIAPTGTPTNNQFLVYQKQHPLA